ncbi:MAG: FGGY-family carbohydrate kinase [Syntrophales bacterium]|nr:FGGY-family carbohydrate kinase [Syntrophales bacterium]MDD4338482.1 FGGY-family carbohydrate kinase [Syntrophales bacterium]HOG07004.1 FGGY-family carbohydrate kinase [Syntrophales bacterium]HOS78533.1 FGGY-family carbohydrate kinase [Syntrophales bacterium]HPB70633.1 FGGY-family carbohydrate kinase [Syntrophales bacterium]
MKRTDKYVLAVDLGTSGPKTALVSVHGDVVDSEFQDTPVILFPDGGAEQDPRGWWDAIRSTAKKVIGKNRVPPEDIAAVSVTTQWSGTVPVDRDGRHLMNGIIWMDCRGSESVKDILKGFPKIEGYPLFRLLVWQRLTGGAPARSGKDPICHILWLKQNHPDIYRRTYKFLEPKDYINLCFTGRFAATYDSILLHWVTDNRDPSHVVYNDRLLKMAGIEREKLPDLIQAMDILGPVKSEVARELGLREGTPVIGGTPDVPSAGVGSGAVRDYEGHIYIGTSSWVSAHVPFKKTDLAHNFGSFPSPIPGRYIILTEQECAGKCLTWLRDNILYHKDELLVEESVPDIYKVLDKIVARVPPGANRILFTPWLYGERSPVDDCTIRASFFNLSLENTREDIARAVFEGVAFNARWLLAPVEKFMGRRFDYLNFIGGGANSDIWSQIFADVFDRKIRQVKDPIYANARGAAFLASMALKYMTLEDIPRTLKIKAEYTPNPENRKLYDERFNEFVHYYKTQRKACARMNKNAAGVCVPPLVSQSNVGR